MLHVDQNTAYYSKSYYQGGAWDIIQPQYLNDGKTLLTNFAQSQGLLKEKTSEREQRFPGITLDQNQLTKLLTDLLNFERTLATTYRFE